MDLLAQPLSAFFAYPSREREVVSAIASAKAVLATSRREVHLTLWEENDISGRLLTDPIFENIAAADVLIADITFINFNVTFEIGYAIGLNKRVFLTRNTNFKRQNNLIDSIGIFDTLGYENYSDELTLAALIEQCDSAVRIPMRAVPNPKLPIYVLQTPQSSTAMIAITSRIKKARLGFRGYLPSDEPRLSAAKAIDDICSCFGAVVPLLASQYADAEIHNIRAAFVAGLAKALHKETLILQPPDALHL